MKNIEKTYDEDDVSEYMDQQSTSSDDFDHRSDSSMASDQPKTVRKRVSKVNRTSFSFSRPGYESLMFVHIDLR